MERKLCKWFCKKFGLGALSGGVAASGGSLSNLMALVMARNIAGLESDPDAVFVASDDCHVSFSKALRIMGLKQESLQKVPTDENGQLQISSLRSSLNKNEGRVQEISEITQGLKALAKELSVPVLALSQLSRAVEMRDIKKPQLSDLRESGSIEQDADVVMFVYREGYYLQRKEPREATVEHAEWQAKMNEVAHLAQIIIGKQRHGPIGNVTLEFEERFTKFKDTQLS